MHYRRLLSHVVVAALLLVSPLALRAADQAAGDWKPLFNGRDLSGWDTWLGRPYKTTEGLKLAKNDKGEYTESLGLNNDPTKVFTVATVDGKPAVRVSGEVFGAITSKDEYENYHFKLEFKWGEKRWFPRETVIRDSGLLYHCIGEHGKYGTFWLESLECQIQENDCGDFYSVSGPIVDTEGDRPATKGPVKYRPGGPKVTVPSEGVTNRIIRSTNYENPMREWNTIEVYVLGTTCVHVVNGKVNLVMTNSRRKVGDKEVPLSKGKLQIQSEGAEVYYRGMAIRPIKEIPSELLHPGAPSVGAAMTDAAQLFVASLNDAERAKAVMKFDDPARLDWHNIPKPQRKGLQYRDMNAEQRKQCHMLLRAALSDVGYPKAMKVLALEANLREGEKDKKNAPLRDPERYFLTIFGKPEMTGTWGWSFEGHHYSQNFVIRDGKVVSDTPSFWGANPATVQIFVPGGPDKGTRTLEKEEQLAFDLVNLLDESQRKKAVIAETAPKEYRAAGQPQAPAFVPEGLAVADMTAEQKKKLQGLLEVYSRNLATELSEARMEEIKAAGMDRVYFAWAGGTKAGVEHYYRVQGPTFVLELVNYQADPAGNPANHIHSVWRSLKGDFGVSAK